MIRAVLFLYVALLLTACSDSWFTERAAAQCRDYGYTPGTEAYSACMERTAANLHEIWGW